MPRKGEVKKREVLPDPKYGDKLVTKFINTIMTRGKKSVAEKTLYSSLDLMAARTKEDSLGLFKRAVDNAKPVLEVRSRRVGGATYQVPIEVRPQRRLSLGMRWLVQAARLREGKSMEEKLAAELIDAANSRGGAIKKKEDTHRMAEANRAFAHYRW
ncbi:MAG: 30S ribosomal protein S7 [Deltaproteobacteria bacterium GWA2_57_13]|uniref:Small ribosomal subunit protein uS7 n=1 Tax=uncultured delta proteobacterium Rifle_16ft_4_minimus_1997 TaxID=1665176 RepID=A0A0H4TLY5_9DELT|nr:30S ribosomal protein S7, small subunit ribosomal protein S7 [uncultured delta proteobacterium Rifle_16ft_4_minimus_1997]OGP19652.1 MAG: 30S ribosomal protein S7 [Deltaproteobacteria bacterium GWA2_57_13]OGQ52336.1 MAG: 30S ribosomal protein S7 [Deltaproteobacteria bacterium RIFCSPLOWO2_02_FULL_57_26]OGQ76119.1 MAG: 30S ribosomal protein S7 [Deltaproteobacteria bacterium RIFCSPLOWO2_12_FULL_57_22]